MNRWFIYIISGGNLSILKKGDSVLWTGTMWCWALRKGVFALNMLLLVNGGFTNKIGWFVAFFCRKLNGDENVSSCSGGLGCGNGRA